MQKAATTIPDSVTVTVTSCARLDLLAQTFESFRKYNTGGRFIVSEDSTDAAVIETVRRTYPDMTVLSGPDRIGIMASIDRLYEQVKTPYIFHLEDDWAFDGPVDWHAAIAILEARTNVANVCVRAIDEIKEKYRSRSDVVAFDGATFRVMHADAHPEFFGWSPNPGLIKTALYQPLRAVQTGAAGPDVGRHEKGRPDDGILATGRGATHRAGAQRRRSHHAGAAQVTPAEVAPRGEEEAVLRRAA